MGSRRLWLGAAAVAALAIVGAAAAGPGGKGGPGGGFGGKGGCGDKGQVAFGEGGFGDKAAFGKGGPAGKFGDKAGPGKGGPGGKGGDKGGPGKGGPAGKGGGRGDAARGGLGVDEVVERLLTFDKNKDSKVVKEELPERMQDLIAKGDTNKDGALDKDEIKNLATTLARGDAFRAFGGRGGFGGFPGGGFPGGGGRGGFGGFPGGGLERALDDLKLTGKKKDTAEAAVKAYQENVRKLTDLARAELLLKMKDVLSEQEFKTFKEALERQPGATPAATPSSDLQRKLDQLQRELEGLRREIRR